MDYNPARYQFGALSSILAEAFGEPGKRTFRLKMESGVSPNVASASVWLEKQQLHQLATYIQEIATPHSSSGGSNPPPEPPWSEGPASVEFKVGKLALGHDRESNCFLLVAYDVEDDDSETATLSFWITMDQGRELSKDSLEVCAAGRPECFLCGQPIDPEGHMCPRANGHAPIPG